MDYTPADLLNDNVGVINFGAAQAARQQSERHKNEILNSQKALQKTTADLLEVNKQRLELEREQQNILEEERKIAKNKLELIKMVRNVMVDVRIELNGLEGL